VSLKVDKYAVSYWEERINRWTVESGEYGVYVGPSSEDVPLQDKFTIEKGDEFEWNGL
jgi:beta-glucosidase